MRVKKIEESLNGNLLSNELIEKAAKIAVEEMRPIDDVRASASYRSTMVDVLVKRAMRLNLLSEY